MNKTAARWHAQIRPWILASILLSLSSCETADYSRDMSLAVAARHHSPEQALNAASRAASVAENALQEMLAIAMRFDMLLQLGRHRATPVAQRPLAPELLDETTGSRAGEARLLTTTAAWRAENRSVPSSGPSLPASIQVDCTEVVLRIAVALVSRQGSGMLAPHRPACTGR